MSNIRPNYAGISRGVYPGGSLVWWNIPDRIPIPRSAWAAQFPAMPLTPEPYSVAFRRAIDGLGAPAGVRTLIRPLKGRDTWAVVFESPTASDLQYSVELALKLTDADIIYLSASGATYWFDTAKLTGLYVAERDVITSGAVAERALSTVRFTCLGVAARKTGGVYYIAQQLQHQLLPVAAMLDQIGGVLYEFPLADTPQARDNLLQLVVEDLKQSAEAVQVHLSARHRGDGIVAAKAALDRLEFYSVALGMAADKADQLRGQLNDLLVAALTAGGDK